MIGVQLPKLPQPCLRLFSLSLTIGSEGFVIELSGESLSCFETRDIVTLSQELCPWVVGIL